jgi:hypothetical protein
LKYVGFQLLNSGRVSQVGEKPKMSLESWFKKQEEDLAAKSGKGKGKASMQPNDQAHYDSSDVDDERPNVIFSKNHRPSSLASTYNIFASSILRGKV